MIKEVKRYRLPLVEDNPGDFVLLKQATVKEIIDTKNIPTIPPLGNDNRFEIAGMVFSLLTANL